MRKRRHDLTPEEDCELTQLIALGRELTTTKLMQRFDVSRGVINRRATKSNLHIAPRETKRGRRMTPEEIEVMARMFS